MSTEKVREVSEQESRRVAEASREAGWHRPSFLRELFLGRFRLDLIHPFPLESKEDRPEFGAFYRAFREFLEEHVDPAEIDRTGEYPEHVVDGLKKLGAFGMKIPKEYGGLGFTNREYQRVMRLLGTYDGNLVALLSAHQSIGVPQPLKVFGTPEQKKKFLPRCAAGEISAFALTEHGVGSDPARLATTCVKSADGSHYVLDGEKLWCTNGTLAKLLVVMARDPKSNKISAFVVEADAPGVKVEHRCHFMGLRAIGNGVLSFTEVKVPAENLIGDEGKGLKIALTTLNDGRLSIPNGSAGLAKVCLEVVREWGAERVQWGRPIGRHESISHRIADIAGYGFAMDSIAQLATAMADDGHYDIRLEAAAAKEWNTDRGWWIVDQTMQIRGGRGYETEQSLAARGEDPIPVERVMRDYRINKIFEGSSEIMHLFMAREAVDKHLDVAGAIIDPEKSFGQKLAAFPKIAAFYAVWYPSRWLGFSLPPRFAEFGRLAKHLRFVDRRARKLARAVFHGMMVHQAKLQNKQAFLFRLVDIANELFATSASITRAHAMVKAGDPNAASAVVIADDLARTARRRIDQLFHDLWRNDDDAKYKVAKSILDGQHTWLEEGTLHKARPAAAPVAAKAPAVEREPVTV
jgi:alkylation response protein AidB-like acyl-CoA dehydrogenase